MTHLNPHPHAIDNNFFYYYMMDGEVEPLRDIAQQPDKPLPYLGGVTTCCNGYLWTTHPEKVHGIARTITDVHTWLLDPENYLLRKKQDIDAINKKKGRS